MNLCELKKEIREAKRVYVVSEHFPLVRVTKKQALQNLRLFEPKGWRVFVANPGVLMLGAPYGVEVTP